MSDGAEETSWAWRPVGLGLAITTALAATAAIVAWSLAGPSNDPVGRVLDRVALGWDSFERWYDQGPVDARTDWSALHMRVMGAEAARGRDVMQEYGCGACHVVPGVAGARGTVGPPLAGFADRAYIAGVLTNAPGELQRWLINPPRFAPDTAMPDMGVTEADAADMAAYLLTLKGAP